MSSPSTRRPSGDQLFTFVVVADTHTNQSEDESNSPFASHRLANARCRHVLAEIDSLDPVFVVHLGDIVHPVPELPTYAAAADAFKQTAKRLRAPLHVVPGNHDIGDKVISWSPAGAISNKKIALYEKHFGAHYYSVDHRDLHLIVVNAPLINSGLPGEIDQKTWLESDLVSNRGKRTFMFIHHPPFISEPDEGHFYDNIDEPGRSWLLELMAGHNIEALFCGHIHNFWYNRFGPSDIYLLPSTAFVRHDYSELFRTTPSDEAGRNDRAKLGYMVVRVYEQGHVAENIRSFGRTLAPDAPYVRETTSITIPHTRTSPVVNLGVDLRHPWAEEVDIPPSGALEEFARKRVRNDYPLQAIWETGLRRLRVPLDDLLDPRIRRRMAALADLGHLFQTYHYGLPEGAAYEALLEHGDLLDALELVGDPDLLDELLTQARPLAARGRPRLLLSRTDHRSEHRMEGGRYSHLVGHGFTLDEGDALETLLGRHPDTMSGVVIRIPRECPVLAAVAGARALTGRLGVRACLYIKSTTNNIAAHHDDDRDNARRIAGATIAALTTPDVDFILDTFVDVDRGYHVRNGLVDRRYNPRSTGRVAAQLVGLMGEGGWEAKPGDDKVLAHMTAPDGVPWQVHDEGVPEAIDLGGDNSGPWLVRK